MRRYGNVQKVNAMRRGPSACVFLAMLLLSVANLSEARSSWASEACSGRLLESSNIVGGAVCVPDVPARIAVLDPYFNMQMALYLDLPVVAAARSGPQWPAGVTDLATEDQLSSIVYLGQFQEPSLEELLSAQPDLILGDAYMHERLLENLTRIAPTVLVDTADWETYFEVISEATNSSRQFEQSLAAYKERLAELQDQLNGEVTASFLRIVPGGFQVYLDGPSAYAPMAVLSDVGIGRPAAETTDGDTVFIRPTWEGVPLLDGDVLLYVFGGGHHVSQGSTLRSETVNHPLWAEIPAVADDQAHEVSPDHWTAFGGLHSAEAILDDIERIFLGE